MLSGGFNWSKIRRVFPRIYCFQHFQCIIEVYIDTRPACFLSPISSFSHFPKHEHVLHLKVNPQMVTDSPSLTQPKTRAIGMHKISHSRASGIFVPPMGELRGNMPKSNTTSLKTMATKRKYNFSDKPNCGNCWQNPTFPIILFLELGWKFLNEIF